MKRPRLKLEIGCFRYESQGCHNLFFSTSHYFSGFFRSPRQRKHRSLACAAGSTSSGETVKRKGLIPNKRSTIFLLVHIPHTTHDLANSRCGRAEIYHLKCYEYSLRKVFSTRFHQAYSARE